MAHVQSLPGVKQKAGQRIDPFVGFRFRVLCVGIRSWRSGFRTIEGLEDENEVIEYREGTDRVTRKLPGNLKYTELGLSRGKSRSNDLQIWRVQVGIFRRTGSYPSSSFRRMLKIQQMDDFDRRLKGWSVHESWCSKLSHTAMEATSSEALVETATIQHEGLLPDPLDMRPL